MINLRFLTLFAALVSPLWAAVTTPPLQSVLYQTASNRDASDYFGNAVAISGDTMVVGAPFEDSSSRGVDPTPNNSAANSGAAYVYVRDQNGNWTQQAYLKASNTGAGDQFGFSVAISGDTIVIGAFAEASKATGIDGAEDDNTAQSAGAAYVFVRENDTWTQEAYLKASNTEANDLFGYSVGISGETLVIGAIGEASVNSTTTDNSATQAGAAYIFARTGSTWSQTKYLKASNPNRSDLFGIAVGISGDSIVVGATGEASSVLADQANNSAANAGAAYVFTLANSLWEQDGYLKASNIGATDLFGRSVAISGTTVVVGAYQEDSKSMGINSMPDNLAANSGAAYVFTRGPTKWVQQAYLKPSNTAAGDAFGISVALDQDTLIVGANGKTSKTGTAYAFVRNANAWSEQSILTAAAPQTSKAADNFGAAVAISGETSAVGAFGQTGTPALTLSGAVYTFDGSGPIAAKIVVQDGFGTVLKSGDTITFSAVATDEPQMQTFTIQNTGNTDLTGILGTIPTTAPPTPPSSTNVFTVDLTGTKTTIQPASTEFPDNFTTFKVKMTGTGLNTNVLTITSSDMSQSPITLKLVSKSFSNTIDSDGDGLFDNAEYQLRDLGFKWNTAQPALVKALRDNANLAGLYDTASALKLNVPLLVKNPTTNIFTLTIGIERSFDLKTFTAFPMTDSQVLVNSAGQLEFQFQSLRTQGFYRLQTK